MTAIDEYRELLNPSAGDADGLPDKCDRLINGLHAISGHCGRCDSRIREARPREYRIRDGNGKIIAADWVLSS